VTWRGALAVICGPPGGRGSDYGSSWRSSWPGAVARTPSRARRWPQAR